MRLCFCTDSTQKKHETFGKLLFSKDSTIAIRIEEEIKRNKFMMEMKNL